MKPEPTKTEELAQEVKIITNHSEFEMIEIEQTDRRVKKMQGIQKCYYKIRWSEDADDPTNPSVESIKTNFQGGELLFVENPYPRKPIGTGKVTYLVADNEDVPEGALSGEIKGWNLEFLASHYAENWFKVIDPKWDKKIKARHEKILEKRAALPTFKHEFDRKYAVKGVGTVDERVKIQVEQPDNVKEMFAKFESIISEGAEEKKELMGYIKKLEKKLDGTPDKKKEPVSTGNGKKTTFAG